MASACSEQGLVDCLSISGAPTWLALWHLLWRGGVVAEYLQPHSVFGRQRGSRVDCFRHFLQFLLHLVQIEQRATDFLGQGCISLEEICSLSPHPFQQWAQNIKVTPEPLAGGSEHPNPIFLRPAAFAVNLSKLGLIPCDDEADRRMALLGISDQLADIAFSDGRLIFVIHQQAWFHW